MPICRTTAEICRCILTWHRCRDSCEHSWWYLSCRLMILNTAAAWFHAVWLTKLVFSLTE